ncbi:MAG: hypothetical protein JOZ96_09640 [Acidobacteria bacterium]|nr:hypothetical protein [Acidobacteriota bacterium]
MRPKNPSRLPPPLAAALLLLLAFATAFAEEKQGTATPQQKSEPSVKFEGGNQYDISNLTDTFELRLPVTVKQGVANVTPYLVAVSVGGLRDASLKKFFSLRMEQVAGNVRVMIVTVYVVCREQDGACRDGAGGGEAKEKGPKAVALGQGTYELLIEMQTGQPEPDLVKLSLKLSAATLEVPASLSVRQDAPFWGEPDTTGALLLTEKSGGKTRLTDITVKQVGITGGVDETTTAELQFGAPHDLGPSLTARAPVTLSSAFPLGKTNGRLMITSPQLAQPLTASFEVVTRRPRWVIVAGIIIGLLFSYLVRTWSVRRIALNEARVGARAAAATLAKEMALRPDAEFKRRVKPEQQKLEGITARTTAAEIKKFVDEANAALTGAVQDFEQRRSAALDILDPLKRLTEASSQLPAGLAAPLAESRKVVEEAGRKIEGNDIVGAKKILDDEVSGLGERLGRAVSDWRLETKAFLSALANVAPLLPSDSSAGLTQELATLQLTLSDTIELTDAGATVQKIESMLGALRTARVKVRELVAGTQLLLRSSRASIEKVTPEKAALAGLDVPQPKKVTALIESFDRLAASLAASVEQPKAGAEALPGALNDLKTQWREALLAQVTADAAAQKAAGDLFAANRYVEATEVVARSLPPKRMSDTLLGETETTSALAASRRLKAGGLKVGEILDALAGVGGRDLPGLTVLHTVRERSIPTRLDSLQVPSLGELLLLKWVRFVIAAAIITAAGYLVFMDRTGTLLDLLGIIGWAFGMNVSVDTILDGQEVKKLLKAP